jgi:thiopeptide-type bacteriocin biosynthesis protein
MSRTPAGVSGTAAWISVHLFYQGSADMLLEELIAPVSAELRRESALACQFFIRHWHGGPHVRWRLLASGSQAEQALRPVVAERSAMFFARRPSEDRLTSAAYDRLAERLALLEPGLGPLELQPNNLARFIPYRPEHHKYGTGPALEAVERHFEESSDLVLTVVRQHVPADRRRALALAALVTAAATRVPTLDVLADRLDRGRRLWSAITGEDRRARVEDRFRARREPLRALVAAIWRRPAATAADPFVDAWTHSVQRLWDALLAAGHPDPVLAMDNCAHMLCNRLGVPPHDEWLLRSLAARAAGDLRDDPRQAEAGEC